MSDNNETIIRQMLDLWGAPDPDAMTNLFAEDGVYFNMPTRRPMEGREAIHQWLSAVADHLTRIDIELVHMASNGDWVLSERLDTHVIGDREMPLPVMSAARVVDDKIVMWRDYYDQKTVEELGLV